MALHCSAAYFSSIIKAGCADPHDELTLQAVTVYNSLVPLARSVAVESLLDLVSVKKKFSTRFDGIQLVVRAVRAT